MSAFWVCLKFRTSSCSTVVVSTCLVLNSRWTELGPSIANAILHLIEFPGSMKFYSSVGDVNTSLMMVPSLALYWSLKIFTIALFPVLWRRQPCPGRILATCSGSIHSLPYRILSAQVRLTAVQEASSFLYWYHLFQLRCPHDSSWMSFCQTCHSFSRDQCRRNRSPDRLTVRDINLHVHQN